MGIYDDAVEAQPRHYTFCRDFRWGIYVLRSAFVELRRDKSAFVGLRRDECEMPDWGNELIALCICFTQDGWRFNPSSATSEWHSTCNPLVC
jgi:hypothetical protein